MNYSRYRQSPYGCEGEKGGSAGNAAEFGQWTTGTGESFEYIVYQAAVEIQQEKDPEVSVSMSGSWLGPNSGAIELHAHDSGLGISYASIGGGGTWFEKFPVYEDGECQGVQCAFEFSKKFKYNSTLPDGEDAIEATACDAADQPAQCGYGKDWIKVDGTAPHGITVTGLPASNTISKGQYPLKIEATDGSGSTPSSGVKSIAVSVDGGPEIGKQAGYCSPGPCTASGEWQLNTEEYNPGVHKLVVLATDNAGNVAKEEFPFTVNSATPVSLGPGSLEPTLGEFSLGATDVSVTAPGSSLSVGRSYRSRHLTEGASGPLGPQWRLSVGGSAGLEKLPNGSVTVSTSGGTQTTFASNGKGGFVAPTGDGNLTLTEVPQKEAPAEYVLGDAARGTTTRFTLPSGEGAVWQPTVAEGPVATDTTTYKFRTVKVGGAKVVEPTEALAPVPAEVSCSPELKKGCRALEFTYASATTASGENANEWGEYEGRLSKISFTGYNPATKGMTTTAVAQYAYDKQGRLRAEWDPRITPALKTAYGYDAEGHVTAVSAPGQQPWLLHYGTSEGDANAGRLLSVSRPSASTALGNGSAPQNTGAPTLSSTTPAIGTTLQVSSNGSWNNTPLSYGYQWEDCNSSGAECTPILGATNQSYTPQARDAGYTLRVQVAAENATGGQTAVTAASSKVPLASPSYKKAFGSKGTSGGELEEPWAEALDASGDVWVTDTSNNRIEEFSASGGFKRAIGWGIKDGKDEAETCTTKTCQSGIAGNGAGQFTHPRGIAINQTTGNIYVADGEENGRIEEFSSTGSYISSFGSRGSGPGQLGSVTALVVDSAGNVWAADNRNERIEEFSSTGTYENEFTTEGVSAAPLGIAISNGKLYVVVNTNSNSRNRVEMYTLSGSYLGQFGESEFTTPVGIGTEAVSGDLYIADCGKDEVEIFNPSGGRVSQFGSEGSGNGKFSCPTDVVATGSGELYVLDSGNDRVQRWEPSYSTNNPLPAPPSLGTSAVSTIDYHVPVSGAAAPYALGSNETKTWAQQDNPVEGTAFFPPDEPEGWPAQDYKRAKIYYLDGSARTVNIATPSRGVGITEYNSTNDVVRTLTAANRAAALGEGAKSAEFAELHDSKSTYNTEGTELLSAVGPQHEVQLDGEKHERVKARPKEEYTYDQGAPSEGGPYEQATTTTDTALTSGGEEDPRTTTMSYGGQEGLGWKLRRPTSVTTDPGGLALTHAAVYEPSSGDLLEARAPGAEDGLASYTYASQFAGAESSKLHGDAGVAIDASGHVWVADTLNSRIEEFSATGTLITAFEGSGSSKLKEPRGITISSNGDVWVTDTGNNRIEEFAGTGEHRGELLAAYGAKGTGNGKFKTPSAIALDSSGDIWVADTSNNRIQELSPTGEYLTKFGTAGSGGGQLKEPDGLAIDSRGDIWVADTGNSRIGEFSETGAPITTFEGSGSTKLKEPHGITIAANGDVWVADTGDGRIEQFETNGTYLQQVGAKGSGNGQLSESASIIFDAKGDLWAADTGNSRVEEWTASSQAQNAHETQTIYYSSAPNSSYPACGEHPEWANLTCQTQPAKQPGGSLPKLPVRTVTYNLWDGPETTAETNGSAIRTTTAIYEAAGRPESITISSKIGAPVPTVSYKYSEESGLPTTESTTVEGTTRKITSVYNTLGQLTSYTDADNNTSIYTYDLDGRLEQYKDGLGTQTYSYDPTTGYMTKLVDSSAGTFTATYNIEGKMLTEGYPNGMTATYTYNQVGEPTSLVYEKTTHCSSKCTWFSDTIVPSIHGQWLTEVSSLSTENYNYDTDGRLTEVQETPVGGKGCTTRIYGYEAETNRTSLTTRTPGSEGKCATEGGTVESHSYDEADRLADPGTEYDEFGNATSLPAADAGGSALKSTYYTNNKLDTQTQNGETIGYYPDPAGRTRETISSGKNSSAVTSHYASNGKTPTWTVETPSGNTRRNIPGMTGTLTAIQTNTNTPILQLTDLHGDIIGTALDASETETELLNPTDNTEYGVPHEGTSPSKYAWLGADGVATEFPTGIIAMGVRSYIPQLGRFLQTDPKPGGSANAYAYTFGDPVNTSDPGGEWTFETPGWLNGFNEEWAAGAEAREAARLAAAREAAEQAAIQAAKEAEGRRGAERLEAEWACEAKIGGCGGGGEAEPLGGSAGWACEYAAETGQEDPECGGVNFANNEDPYNHSPNVQSQCNQTGQDCPGHRGGGGGSGEGWAPVDRVCIFTFWVPGVGYACGLYGVIRYATH